MTDAISGAGTCSLFRNSNVTDVISGAGMRTVSEQ